MTPSVENAITTGTNLLASSSDSAKLDAQVLLLNILQKPRSLIVHKDKRSFTSHLQSLKDKLY